MNDNLELFLSGFLALLGIIVVFVVFYYAYPPENPIPIGCKHLETRPVYILHGRR